MDDTSLDLRHALEAFAAMYTDRDPTGFMEPWREAAAQDAVTGGEARRLGFISALTLTGASLLAELDRVGGSGTAQAWLTEQRQHLD